MSEREEFRSNAALRLICNLSALSEASCGSQIEACLHNEPSLLENGVWLAFYD